MIPNESPHPKRFQSQTPKADSTALDPRPGWHQHANGGGWVEDTALVAPEVWVGPLAIICGAARVGIRATIDGGVVSGGEVSGGVVSGGVVRGGLVSGGLVSGGLVEGGHVCGGVVSGGVVSSGVVCGGEVRGGIICGGQLWGGVIMGGGVKGGVVTESPLQIQGTRAFMNETYDGKIQIGCKELTLAEWRLKGPALALSHRFTPEEVAEYTRYLYLFECLRPALSATIPKGGSPQ